MSYPIAVRNGNTTMIHPVRAARYSLGWSQRDLARESGVVQTTVSHMENGYHVHQDTAALIAAALGRDVDDLFTKIQVVDYGKRPMVTNYGSTKHSIISTSSDVCKGCYMTLPISGVCGTCE